MASIYDRIPFAELGDISLLPVDYHVAEDKLPPWRIAVFSLTYVMPENQFPTEIQNRDFIGITPNSSAFPSAELTDEQYKTAVDSETALVKSEWKLGKAEGIRQVAMPELQGHEGEKFWVPPEGQEELRKTGYKLGKIDGLPQSYYELASRRYDGALEDAIAALSVDADVLKLRKPPTAESLCGEEFHEAVKAFEKDKAEFFRKFRSCYSSARFHHIDYPLRERELVSKENPEGNRPKTHWRIYSISSDTPDDFAKTKRKAGTTEYSDVSVVSLELSEFRDPGVKGGSLFNRFITVTVAVENASNLVLDSVSQALQRRRNHLWVKSGQNGDMEFFHEIELLEDISILINEALGGIIFPNLTTEDRALNINRSNVLELNRGKLAENSQFPVMPTMRAVVVVPNKTIEEFPPSSRLTIEQDSEKPKAVWSKAKIWAWALASGADDFVPGFPNFQIAPMPEASLRSFNFWTSWVDDYGFSMIRTQHPETGDFKFFNLVTTRFVDLLLLVERNYIVMKEIDKALRKLKFTDASRSLAEKGDSDKEALNKLSREMEHFRQLQSDFVRFRDRTWRNSVPKYKIDTQILRSLRLASGVEENYRELQAELNVREDIYSSIFSTHRVKIQAREEERKEMEAQRESNFQTWMAIFGVVLAVPGFVELGLTLELVIAALIAFFIGLGIFMWRKHKNPRGLEFPE